MVCFSPHLLFITSGQSETDSFMMETVGREKDTDIAFAQDQIDEYKVHPSSEVEGTWLAALVQFDWCRHCSLTAVKEVSSDISGCR